MPKLTPDAPKNLFKKIILMGDSGTGKTGALISLALAGYNIYIADFDGQAEEVIRGILAGKLTAKKDPISKATHDEALSKFDIEVFTDKSAIVGGKPKVIAATAWTGAMKQLNTWSRSGLTNRDVIVIDSLTFASKAAAHNYLQLSSKLNKSDELDWNDYNPVQNSIASLLALLYSPAVSANVIVNAHIDIVEIRADFGAKDSKGRPELEVVDTKALPKSIGKALAGSIPTYFNTSLVCKSFGPETSRKRFIFTRPVGLVDTKTPKPQNPKTP